MIPTGEAITSPEATLLVRSAHHLSYAAVLKVGYRRLTNSLNFSNKMRNLTDTQNHRLLKAIKYLALAIATSIAMALGLTSCNVTRTITTESKSLTRGDTAVIIQTKTIESYNAKKN